MERAGYVMIRYADDFVVLCRTAEEAVKALEMVKEWTIEAELQLHDDKTRIVDMNQPVAAERQHDETQRKGATDNPPMQWTQHVPTRGETEPDSQRMVSILSIQQGNHIHNSRRLDQNEVTKHTQETGK
jgi:hypothetical protein